MTIAPDITKFDHYAPFLKERFVTMKASKRQFSYGYCARKIGATSSYLKHALEGRRKIGLSRVSKIARVFELTEFETQYFTLLVIRELTKDADTRKYLTQVLKRLSYNDRNIGDFEPFKNDNATTAVISNWLYGALVELMSFSDFQDDNTWIASKLIDGAKIGTTKIRAAIEDLVARGIVEKKGASYVLTKAALSVPDPFDGDAFKVYRGIIGKTWDVLGNPAAYAKNHFLEAIAAVSVGDETLIFAAAAEYRDKVLAIAKQTKNPSRLLVISNNLYNLGT